MKKNLLQPEAAQQIIKRVQQLDVTSSALWGQMTASEMLLHANLCNEEIFEPLQPATRTTAKQFLLRVLALYIAPTFKKNIHGDKKKETKGKISADEFEIQKENFISLINRFPGYTGALTPPHIAFGNISTNEWGIAAYKHMDHHLRQFGV
jgi:hypothetical protein